MPNSRLSMRKIKDVLRLHFTRNLSARQIGLSVKISHNTVSEYLRRARAAGLSWPLAPDLSDSEIENLLFPALPTSSVKRPEPSWADVHTERKRRSVTLLLLWEEYRAQYPDGLQYSCFCERYRAFVGKLKPSMRQIHVAGEKAFIDYAGQTIPIQDPFSGEVREAQIFVAVLGASNYTYLVMDNLNTHSPGSLYEAFVPEKAKALWDRFEFVYTPKHGSWLNMAEIELNVLIGQCLNRRIADMDVMRSEVKAWESERNGKKVCVKSVISG